MALTGKAWQENTVLIVLQLLYGSTIIIYAGFAWYGIYESTSWDYHLVWYSGDREEEDPFKHSGCYQSLQWFVFNGTGGLARIPSATTEKYRTKDLMYIKLSHIIDKNDKDKTSLNNLLFCRAYH